MNTSWRVYWSAAVLSVVILAVVCVVCFMKGLVPAVYFCAGAAFWNLVMLAMLIGILGILFRKPGQASVSPDGYLRGTVIIGAKMIWAVLGLVLLIFYGPLNRGSAISVCLGIAVPLLSLILVGIFFSIISRNKVNN